MHVAFNKALASARAILDESLRLVALAKLIPHFALEERRAVLGEVLACIKKGRPRDWACSHALGALASHLAPEQLDEALACAKTICDRDRSRTLVALAPHLTPERLDEALASAKVIGDEFTRSNTLAKLMAYIVPERRVAEFAEALASAKAIFDPKYRSRAIAALAPHLAPEQSHAVFGEALACAKAIGDRNARLDVMVALIGCVPATLQVDALLALIDAVGQASRSTALSAAAAGTQATFELGGQGAVLELRRAINDVFRWYP
jgi:hypothetical protein